MPSLQEMSDDQLRSLVQQKRESSQPKDLSKLSDDELRSIVDQKRKTSAPMDQLDAAKSVAGNELTFGLGPVAAGVGGFLGSGYENLKMGKGLGESLDQAKQSYSDARSENQGEVEKARKDYPTQSGLITVGSALATAPLAAAKTIKGAAGLGAAQGLARGLGHGDDVKDLAVDTAGGGLIGGTIQAAAPYASKAAGWVGNKIGSGATKLASSLTGVGENDIKTYAKNTEKIDGLIKKYGADNLPEAVESERQGLLQSTNSYRQNINKQIGDVLDQSADKAMPIKPVLDKLTAIKSKFDPKLQRDLITNIDELMAKYEGAAVDVSVTPRQLNIIRNDLQEIADKGGAYKGAQGAIVGYSKDLGTAAKQAARDVRQQINNEFPAMAKSYNQLAELHNIQNNLGRGLLKEGANETSLLNASKGSTNKSKYLKKLSDTVGSNSVENLKDISAAKTFANPPLLSMDTTGKAVGRALLGGGIGYAAGGESGGLLGAAASNPMVLKKLIQSGKITRPILEQLAKAPIRGAATNLGIKGLIHK